MSSSVVLRPESLAPVVELAAAALCQDCDGITSAVHGACRRCGSRATLALASVLGGVRPARVLPVFHESPKQRRERLARLSWAEGMS